MARRDTTTRWDRPSPTSRRTGPRRCPSVYGASYKAIPSDRLFAYSQSNPPPACGGYGRTPYSEVAGNAFYCDQGDFVAWDEQGLFAKLRQQYGDFAPALVLAHEWGHAVQARVGFQTSATVYMEQQADCFAGAWAAHVAQDGRLDGGDLDSALAGLLGLRDPSGIDGSQEGAHGNGFDRVRAFQDGFEGSAATCAGYEDNAPTVTESAYTSYADYASGGDMSLSRAAACAHQEPAGVLVGGDIGREVGAEGRRVRRHACAGLRRRHRRRRAGVDRRLLLLHGHHRVRPRHAPAGPRLGR